MVAHERYITVTETGQVTISGLPVRPGQRVRVTVALEGEPRENLAAKAKALFRQMQAAPEIQKLTDDEMAREIALHRRSLGAA